MEADPIGHGKGTSASAFTKEDVLCMWRIWSRRIGIFMERSEFGQEGGMEVEVVLMDTELPVMDGNTVTRIIRQKDTEGRLRRHVPILGFCASARADLGNPSYPR
ncbi:hypothetical protein BGX38DRAFT_1267165 [Terfezia claveryi]|nr:hypothetical protein BGX38DRAFT_1267165 [Terfezia claveryi]